MANHLYSDQTGCHDYWISINGNSTYGYRRLRFEEFATGTDVTGDSIPLLRASIAGIWHDDLSATVIEEFYFYGTTACVALSNASVLPFQVSAEGNGGTTIVHDWQATAPAPNDADASQCMFFVDTAVAPIGGTITATLYVRDNLNRFKTTGGDTVVMTPAGYADADLAVSAVTDNGDGSYSATITKPTAGLAHLTVNVNGGLLQIKKTVGEFSDTTVKDDSAPDSVITVAGNTATVTLNDSSGVASATASDKTTKLRLFASDGVTLGMPTWDGINAYTFDITAPEGAPANVKIYGFLSDYLIGDQVNEYPVTATPTTPPVPVTSRELGLTATVNGPAPSRELGLTAIVNDVTNPNSFPVPDGASQSIPRYTSWSIK